MGEPVLPNRAEALDILARAGCSRKVIEHCKAVSKFSVRIGRAFARRSVSVDLRLVEIGGLLHDIGRSRTHSVDHGPVGGEIARLLGLPQSIIRVVERHVGGGIPKDEARRLGWAARDYVPEAWEERIVCYADKRVEGLRVVSIEQALRTYVANLGEDHAALERIRKLHKEIVAVVEAL